MEIRFRNLRCLDYIAGVLSLGCLPLFFWFYRRQLPARLTEEGMVLRSGRQIPWSAFTKLKATEVHYGDALVGTRYELWHSSGKVEIGTDKIQNAQAIVDYVMAHLPPPVVGARIDRKMKMNM
jgi:hypothetical protein